MMAALPGCLSCNGRGCAGCHDTGKEMPQELRLGVYLQRLANKQATYHHGDIGYAGELLARQLQELEALRGRVAALEALNCELLFDA